MKYGRKLTDEEFQHEIFELLKRHNTTTKEGKEAYDKAELDVTVNYRLGVDYPDSKREKLRKLQKKSFVFILSLLALYGIKSVILNQIQEKIMTKIMSFVVGGASDFMSKDEIKEMFL